MCWALKVANQQREKKVERSSEIDQWLYHPSGQYSDEGTTSRAWREREMSAMVSALAHVVSGDVVPPQSNELDMNVNAGDSSASVSSSSSASSRVGTRNKRGREMEGGGEFSTRLSREVGNQFSHGAGSSSSGVRGKPLNI